MIEINILTFLMGIWLFSMGSVAISYGLYTAGKHLLEQWRRR